MGWKLMEMSMGKRCLGEFGREVDACSDKHTFDVRRRKESEGVVGTT